jgi:hypothetical protein
MMSQSLADRKKKLRKVTPVEARQYWDDLYFASQTDCIIIPTGSLFYYLIPFKNANQCYFLKC